MSDLQVGILGCGVMGGNHARVLSQLRDVRLLGVYDVNRTAAEALSSRHGCFTYDAPELLVEQADAIVIAAPTTAHALLVRLCLEAGVPCLCEKPVTATLYEAQQLFNEERGLGSLVTVGMIERYNPAWRTAVEALGTQRPIGYTFLRDSAWVSRSQDISVVGDLMIHDLDLVCSLEGPPAAVLAMGRAIHGPQPDYAVAILSWSSGTVATLTASKTSQRKLREVAITTPQETIFADLLRRTVKVHRGVTQDAYQGTGLRAEESQTTIIVPPTEPLRAELEAFVRAARGITTQAVPIGECLVPLGLVENIEAQVRSSR